eukprot:3680428-Rhodomonas_salina.3
MTRGFQTICRNNGLSLIEKLRCIPLSHLCDAGPMLRWPSVGRFGVWLRVRVCRGVAAQGSDRHAGEVHRVLRPAPVGAHARRSRPPGTGPDNPSPISADHATRKTGLAAGCAGQRERRMPLERAGGAVMHACVQGADGELAALLMERERRRSTSTASS